jgi:hypothetical protein
MLLSHEFVLLGFSLAGIAAETLGQRQQKGPVLLLLLRLGRIPTVAHIRAFRMLGCAQNNASWSGSGRQHAPGLL